MDVFTLGIVFNLAFIVLVTSLAQYQNVRYSITSYIHANKALAMDVLAVYLHIRLYILVAVFLALAYQLSGFTCMIPEECTLFLYTLFPPLMCDSTWAAMDPVTGKRIEFTGTPIPWAHTNQLTVGNTVLNNMYEWSRKECTPLALYIENNCTHLLSPLGTHSNPLMTDVLSTAVPQGHSFINTKLSKLVNIHMNKGGVYLFYDPTVPNTPSPECTKYVGMANLFANRLRSHMHNYKHPELPVGQMKLYNIMRNNPNLDLHWQPIYSITPYTLDYAVQVGNMEKTTEYILQAFSSYQMRAIEQSVITYCLPNANAQQLVTLDYLGWYPGLASNTAGRDVWIYLNNGKPIDLEVDVPYRVAPSVYKATEITGLSSVPLLKGYVNTMQPVYSPTLKQEVFIWRWDQAARIGEKRGIPRTPVADLPTEPTSLPEGEIHTYTNVNGQYVPFKVYGSYRETHADLGSDYSFKGFLDRITKHVNTAHGTYCTSVLTGGSYMIYFARNPNIRTSATRAMAKGLITVTDTVTNKSTTHKTLREMRVEYKLDKEMRMTMYINHGYLIKKRYRITRG